ncbi:MAG: hypothetical protein KJ811_01780, partial [Candidatus Margulisbacteria bacterium]|nr:hypothetical protein [Candidatus Margulisiibacteriota bacterium]
MLRYLTAGESHGRADVAILKGCPSVIVRNLAKIDLQTALSELYADLCKLGGSKAAGLAEEIDLLREFE